MNKLRIVGIIGLSSMGGAIVGFNIIKSNNWMVISSLSSLTSIITTKYAITGKLL